MTRWNFEIFWVNVSLFDFFFFSVCFLYLSIFRFDSLLNTLFHFFYRNNLLWSNDSCEERYTVELFDIEKVYQVEYICSLISRKVYNSFVAEAYQYYLNVTLTDKTISFKYLLKKRINFKIIERYFNQTPCTFEINSKDYY